MQIDHGKPAEEKVKVYLQFDKIEAATKAVIALNNRFFGGRSIIAEFYDEDKYALGLL